MTAPSIHGESGLDGPALPEPVKKPVGQDACALMAEVLEQSQEPVTLISTGPLTNAAALLLLYPNLKAKIREIYLMGGGIGFGNWTPAAEFNILADPEAADVVFTSGIPITMAGLDVTERALVFPEDFARIRAVGNPVARVVADWLDFFYEFHRKIGYTGAPVHDAVAVAALVGPEIFTMRSMYVAVETAGDYCRGATVGDPLGLWGKPANARVILDLDRAAFVDLLVEAVSRYGKGADAR